MANFDTSIDKILKAEGGLSQNRSDLGNYLCGVGGWAKRKTDGGFICDSGRPPLFIGTNYGISAPTLSKWRNRVVSISDMRNMSVDEAKNIYKTIYWNTIGGDYIEDQNKADILFDAYVNQTSLVKEMLSNTLNLPIADISYPLKTDSVATRKINSDKNFIGKFIDEREKKYKHIATRPGQAGFLAGWLSRLDDFRPFVKKYKTPIIIILSFAAVGGIVALIVNFASKK